jgi:excinuclease ABC subunit B
MRATSVADARRSEEVAEEDEEYLSDLDRLDALDRLREEMSRAAEDLEFEKAAKIRDKIRKIETEMRQRSSHPRRRR